ncbi:MAG: acyl carrier protein [Haloarcula sp.]
MSDQPDELETEIDNIVADRCGVEQEAFDDSTRFDGDILDADSLDIVEIAEAIDANLGVYIPDEDLEEIQTVADVKNYVRNAV